MKSGKGYNPFGDNSSVVNIPTPTADHTATGIKKVMQANETQAFGDFCFINSSGKAQLVDADAVATCRGRLMLIDSAAAADGYATYLVFGEIRDDSWSWTVGGPVYASTTGTTGNTLTQTAPSGTDDVIQQVGIATHANRILFNPQITEVVHA